MIIKKSALAVITGGRLLVVRKRGSPFLLMPGGKPEGSETAEQALHREIREELGCGIDEASLSFLGDFSDAAADKDAIVSISLYSGRLTGTPKASSEIDELVWVGIGENDMLSPIIRNKIIPFLASKKMM